MKQLFPKGKKPTRTEQAANALLCAHAEAGCQGRFFLVELYEKEHAEFMKPVEGSTEVIMGEAVPLPAAYLDSDDFPDALAVGNIRDTLLKNPDAVAVDASVQRTKILHHACALELGIDAANSIQAKNSLEKMLAHQMAVCHVKAMEVITNAADLPRGREDLQVKMLNVAARLIDTYQKGMNTFTKTRNAGKQTITVKQVHVTGGQNIIADKITKGGAHDRE